MDIMTKDININPLKVKHEVIILTLPRHMDQVRIDPQQALQKEKEKKNKCQVIHRELHECINMQNMISRSKGLHHRVHC